MTERKYESMAHRDVTRMAKILVAAAGGEIRVPQDWMEQNRYIDLELEQIDSTPGVVIYRTKWLRDPPNTIAMGARQQGKTAAMEDERIRALPHARIPKRES